MRGAFEKVPLIRYPLNGRLVQNNPMNEALLTALAVITDEERELLSGRREIDRSLYMHGTSAEVDSALLLDAGKLITIRPHTRFVRFPRHTHNYVEMVYMCKGHTRHIINGTKVLLSEGELLLMRQNATQEIEAAGEDDIAVNFIIQPQFFDTAIHMMDESENSIRDFLVGCLRGDKSGTGYLHFRVADILPIQNLVENLIWTLVNAQPNKRSINQLTMGLLFLQLVNHTETLRTDPHFAHEQLMLQVLRYVEEHYAEGSLEALAAQLNYDVCFLSRAIKRETGQNFTVLIQNKRLRQAAYLLRSTAMRVIDISASVGYENISYFHRIFRAHFGMTPHKYRTSTETAIKDTFLDK